VLSGVPYLQFDCAQGHKKNNGRKKKNGCKKKNTGSKKNGRQALDDNNQTENIIVSETCLEPNYAYNFSISDSFGDGLCCYEQNGA